MESVLAIFCIVFFVILTIGIAESNNLDKFHKDDCHVIYVPKDYDLEDAFKLVSSLHRDGLKKKARLLGATKEYVDSQTDVQLKVYIIQNIVSNEHILFTDISEDISIRDNIKKREYCRDQIRKGTPEISCPTNPQSLADYDDVVLPEPTTLFEYPNITTKDIINQMKLDDINYENKNIIYDI